MRKKIIFEVCRIATILFQLISVAIGALEINPMGLESLELDQHLLLAPVPSDEVIQQKAPPNINILAERGGYKVVPYETVTTDGYMLVIHRLIKSGDEETPLNQVSKPVVLLQHGLAQSSSDWLINDSGKSLAMLLVDGGYQVWIGNSRGNKHSNSHKTLKKDTMEYYNFTFHEMGLYDIPATIDLVLKETGQSQINYVGISIGATNFFVAMSTNPEYANRIKFMGAISPLAYLSNTKTPIKLLAPHLDEIKDASIKLGVMRINPETLPLLINSQLAKLCFWRKLSKNLCNSIYKMLDEFDLRTIEEKHLEPLWKYVPTTTSAKTCIHLLQLMNNEELFDEYDYGPTGNAKKYGSALPPAYILNNVRIPVAIFTGKEEIFTTSEDTEVLKRELPYVVRHVEADSTFKVHTDFTHEAKAVNQIFEPMIFILDFYNKK